MHLSDAVLESVMVFRLGAGAVAEVVVPLCLAKAGFLSGCTVYTVPGRTVLPVSSLSFSYCRLTVATVSRTYLGLIFCTVSK